MSSPNTIYRFHAVEDFVAIKDPQKRLVSALEYGIRVASQRNLPAKNIHAINGPLFGFRLRAKKMILDFNNSHTLFIREVVIPPNSNIELHYYDISRDKEYVVEIERNPGINLDLRSGFHAGRRDEIFVICARDGGVMVLHNGTKQYIL